MPIEDFSGFTFSHTGNSTQPSGDQRANFDKRGDELAQYIKNKIVAVLNSVVEGSSGAENIGSVPIDGVGDANTNKVFLIQKALKGLIDDLDTAKANKVDVYTKNDLDPYLRGGDTLIHEEVYTIVNSNNGDGTFTYKDANDVQYTGQLDASGNQIFNLLQGKYDLGQNRIEAYINDTLHRSVSSGGLQEVSQTQIMLTDPQGNNTEISFVYYERIGIVGTGLVVINDTNPGAGYIWFKVVG